MVPNFYDDSGIYSSLWIDFNDSLASSATLASGFYFEFNNKLHVDANSFVSVKLWKQTKNCTNILDEFNPKTCFSGTDSNRKHRNLVYALLT